MLSNQEDLDVFKLIHANSKRFPKVTVRACEAPKHVTACTGPDSSFEVIVETSEMEDKPSDEDMILSKAVKSNTANITKGVCALLLKEEEELIRDLVGSNLSMLGRRAKAAVTKM